MSMITRCPNCSTTFRVQPQQLQARNGTVRCGQCAHVFDGFKTLDTLADAPPPTAQPAVEPPLAPPAEQPPPMPQVTPPIGEPAAAAAFEPIPPLETLRKLRRSQRVPEPDPLLTIAPPADIRRRTLGWSVGVVALMIAFAGEIAYFYRSEIVARVPEARQPAERICAVMHCVIALPQHPRQISIEASDMQARDPSTPGLIALTATMRSQAAYQLAYPALDVVLTNTKEHTVARRIFLPAEYLGAGKDPRAGIPPNGEITVRLDLDTGDLGAAGFRLDLLPAPAL